MKKKDFQNILNKPVEELRKMEAEFRDKLWKMQEDLKRGKVKNIGEVHDLKKDIARVLTAMSARVDKSVK